MDEVEVSAIVDSIEDRVLLRNEHAVPAHVRNLLPTRQTYDAPLEDTQALVLAALFADVEQRLLTHANAQERPSRRDVFLDRLDKIVLAQVLHGICGRAYARHDQGIGVIKIPSARRDQRPHTGVRDRARHAVQVPSAVVDNNEFHIAILAGDLVAKCELHHNDIDPALELVTNLSLRARVLEPAALV